MRSTVTNDCKSSLFLREQFCIMHGDVRDVLLRNFYRNVHVEGMKDVVNPGAASYNHLQRLA